MAVKYVAYIDESGDPGLESLKPQNPNGSSEWLVVSCFLVPIENDHHTVRWVKEILSKFSNVQTPHIHFTDLLQGKKEIACKVLAEKPARLFVTMSNKRNLVGYKNLKIRDGNKNWLYWWLMRLLLERVTEYCSRQTPNEEKGQAKLRVIFSRRGGMRYIDFKRYIDRLRRQSSFGSLYIDQGDLSWDVIDDEEIRAFGHKERAGLQLADIVAGSFFQAVERNRPADCNPICAKVLKTRMATNKSNQILGYSIKTMPDLDVMNLTVEQRHLFEAYGYSKSGWD